ncbi:hypothetical protein B0H16DRAFT_1452495 [Mycena metata]|uniref:Uncharacterized protein n=1 Tax=Mycena metata TaxID=1033252 RepID=A0AAD7JPJ6_9AGAR|nr:hypothetical protein B0H16DRAFT_1452495 [Mycena metata]
MQLISLIYQPSSHILQNGRALLAHHILTNKLNARESSLSFKSEKAEIEPRNKLDHAAHSPDLSTIQIAFQYSSKFNDKERNPEVPRTAEINLDGRLLSNSVWYTGASSRAPGYLIRVNQVNRINIKSNEGQEGGRTLFSVQNLELQTLSSALRTECAKWMGGMCEEGRKVPAMIHCEVQIQLEPHIGQRVVFWSEGYTEKKTNPRNTYQDFEWSHNILQWREIPEA